MQTQQTLHHNFLAFVWRSVGIWYIPVAIRANILIVYLEQHADNFLNINTYIDDMPISYTAELTLCELIKLHPRMGVTMALGDSSRHFVHIYETCRVVWSTERSIYRKDTWNEEYLHFNGSTSIINKCGLIRTIFNKTPNIVT